MSPGLRFSHTDSDLPKLPSDESERTDSPAPSPEDGLSARIQWIFIGRSGLRAGWLALLFYLLFRVLYRVLGSIAIGFFPSLADSEFGAWTAVVGELLGVVAAGVSLLIVARIDGRSPLDYFLRDRLRGRHFIAGIVAGLITVSSLIMTLAGGGWMRVTNAHMTPGQIAGYAVLWAFAFLMTGLLEEGIFRCFLLYTLSRGINFWWAFAAVSAVCMWLLFSEGGNNGWGVYLMALLGLVPCMILHQTRARSAGFWHAAWVTSTFFGFWHTGNTGESQMGIFAAAAVGLVFCVSVRLTGSAWWAIGCHMAWDWAETYLFGAADSGLAAPGHLMTSQPMGNSLMSGGTVGPEGSVMALVAIHLLLLAILLIYRRRAHAAPR